ncbi:MAG: CRISPR-associated endonuclease Cas2 [Lactobacillus sp.]|jgi:CRISPR-associated protein Cas2|nr:CRISPR-associated endonuclease Cas2 [Lactobacillus sp.]
MIIVAYDIAITSDGGPKRLRHVAKTCSRYGQRVQNSVFECLIDDLQFKQLQSDLAAIIDETKDSVRFYNLGRNHKNKIIHIGTREVKTLDSTMII